MSRQYTRETPGCSQRGPGHFGVHYDEFVFIDPFIFGPRLTGAPVIRVGNSIIECAAYTMCSACISHACSRKAESRLACNDMVDLIDARSFQTLKTRRRPPALLVVTIRRLSYASNICRDERIMSHCSCARCSIVDGA